MANVSWRMQRLLGLNLLMDLFLKLENLAYSEGLVELLSGGGCLQDQVIKAILLSGH